MGVRHEHRPARPATVVLTPLAVRPPHPPAPAAPGAHPGSGPGRRARAASGAPRGSRPPADSRRPRPHRRGARILPPLLGLAALGAAACDPAPSGRVYAASGFTDRVHVLDAADGSLLDTLVVDPRPGEVDEPHGLAVSPDGRHLWVTVSHGNPTLWKFERRPLRLVGRLRLELPGAARIGITPDGERAFVPDYWRSGMGRESHVAVVRLHDLVVEATPTVCPAPHDAVVSPGGDRVAVTCTLGDEIVVLDASTLEERRRFPAGPAPGPPGTPRWRPGNLVWSPSGDTLWVTQMEAGEVRAYDPVSGRVLAAVSVGGMPMQVAWADGGRLVVPARDGTVSVLEASAARELHRIPLPEAPHPHAVAVDGPGRVAFVGYEGEVGGRGGVVALEVESGRVLWRRETGVYTLGVAWGPA